MTYKVREYTCRVLEALDEHILNKDMLIDMMLQWMSESDVKAMCEANDICLDDEEDEDEDEDEEEDEAESDLENPNSVHSRYHY
jgi:hypothetical protein